MTHTRVPFFNPQRPCCSNQETGIKRKIKIEKKITKKKKIKEK